MNVKMLLVDDHPMLRHGLREALAKHSHLTVVGESSTAAEALRLAGELAPDLVVMDIHLPDQDGLVATLQILQANPSLKVVIFSSDCNRSLIDEALQAGACGYIAKSSSVDELIRAIDVVMSGKLYLSPDLSAVILEGYRKSLAAPPEPSRPLLSERDKQLLRFVAAGRRNKEIAVQLGISVKSVEAYRSRLMKRLGCASSAEMVRYAVREGIAEP